MTNPESRTPRHFVVVGGSRGLGLALARAVVRRGDRVTITGRDLERTRAAAATIEGGDAAGLECDLTDWASIARLFSEIESVDHLVLTALERDFNTIADFRPDDSLRTSTMKNVGYATAVHYALPAFTATASVVMFSGTSMWRPMPGSTTISMANAGVLGLVNSLAIQIAPVRVNSITPGVIGGTDAVDNADDERRKVFEQIRQRTPGQRLPNPDHVVAGVFALTDNAGINGENLTIDAGLRLV